MNFIKASFKNAFFRVWFIVTCVLLVLAIVVNVLAETALRPVIVSFLKDGKPIMADGVEAKYVAETESKADALKKANELNVEVNKEGIILLKNDNKALPLDRGAKVSVFGKNSVNLVYGGSGSGGSDTSSAVKLHESLEKAGFAYNPTLYDFYKNDKQSGTGRPANPDIEADVVTLATGETPIASYNSTVQGSFPSYNDAALIVFSRIGGEGNDLPRTMKGVAGARKDDDHYLQLDKNETDLLQYVCGQNFKKVIVVINSSTAMELAFLEDSDYYAYQEKVDAAIWIGGPGGSGAEAIGSVLCGDTNPSGRTVDIYAKDFKQNPTWNNFGSMNEVGSSNQYISSSRDKYYFVEYEEGIYVGYRYYETRGFTDGDKWYQDNVVYPFGYGLSYTTFDWSITNADEIASAKIEKGKKFTVKVEVKNTGDRAGKEVVQLYVMPPYEKGKIEKSAAVLCGFAKTDMLYPVSETGKDKPNSQVVNIEVDPYLFASYDYNDKNDNGKKCYELDDGDYFFRVSRNSHDYDEKLSFNINLANEIIYDTDPVTGKKVENRYDDADDELETVLSRADWTGTWPKAPTEAERTKDAAFIDALSSKAHNNPNVGSITSAPTQATAPPSTEDGKSEVTLRDMVGKPYDDPDWEKLLSAVTFEDMAKLCNEGAFHTNGILYVEKPLTIESDGPAGFYNFMNDSIYGTCAYASECVLGATWNVELMEEMGKSVGEEALWGDTERGGLPYAGWYAPGVNIHRSPFGGRNFEYFSEDSFLTSKMAAAEIRGVVSKGVTPYVKHFAVNEQETNRDSNGLSTWLTEQSLREIYLRPFEMAVKEGGTRGIMSSFNRIGSKWTGGDYRLLTEILRDEWGFKGTVICDFNLSLYMNAKQMTYAGGDLNLTNMPKNWAKKDNAADVTMLRQAMKNIFYTVANSNAMNSDIIGYKLATWEVIMIVVDCLLFVGLAVWGTFAVLKVKKGMKEKKAQEQDS